MAGLMRRRHPSFCPCHFTVVSAILAVHMNELPVRASPPDIAVVIPTFNRAHLLQRAVHSVLAQEDIRFELIIVDDGSDDGTDSFVRSLEDPRVKYLYQENQGVSAARNAGASAATASFLTFLDSDDEADHGWLKFYRQAQAGGARFASCGMRFVLPNGDVTFGTPSDDGPAFGHIRSRLLAGCIGMDRDLFFEIGGFRPGLTFSEHTDLGLRLGRRMLAEPFAATWTDTPLVTTYRRNDAYNPTVRFESAMTLLESVGADLARDRQLLAQYQSIAGVAAARLGRQRQARRLFMQAIRTRPTTWRNYVRLLGTVRGLRRLGQRLAGTRSRTSDSGS